MKLSKIKLSCFIGLVSLSIGVNAMANLFNSLNHSKWITINNLEEGIELSFPRKPFELKFTPSFKGSSSKLHIYSAPIEKGLLVFSVLTSPEIDESVLDPAQFKQNFKSYLVKYLFQDPHFFQRSHKFESSIDQFKSFPLLSFLFTYQDSQTLQLIKGAAIVQNDTLYQIFYLAPANEYNHKILKKFIGSFNFK